MSPNHSITSLCSKHWKRRLGRNSWTCLLSLALLLEISHLARDNNKSLGHIVISMCGGVHKFHSEVGTLLLKKKGMHTGVKESLSSLRSMWLLSSSDKQGGRIILAHDVRGFNPVKPDPWVSIALGLGQHSTSLWERMVQTHCGREAGKRKVDGEERKRQRWRQR